MHQVVLKGGLGLEPRFGQARNQRQIQHMVTGSGLGLLAGSRLRVQDSLRLRVRVMDIVAVMAMLIVRAQLMDWFNGMFMVVPTARVKRIVVDKVPQH